MIIKCPECGRQVSEKAPTCPACGVEIAGKITRCKQCGEVFFVEDGICPACQEPISASAPSSVRSSEQTATVKPANDNTTRGAQQATQTKPTATSTGKPKTDETPSPTPSKGNTAVRLIIALLFALTVCGALFYFYNRAQTDKESEDYEFALRSSDPEVLLSYLLRYSDAPADHRDSIQAHLQLIQKGEEDWQNALLSNSRSALKNYVDKNPNSPHCQEALVKIDSLDWLAASKSNDQNTVEQYIHDHADGRYIDDAKVLLSKIQRATVQPDEQTMVTELFRKFFQSINSRDESRLTSSVSTILQNFLGKENASSEDVVAFMRKQYKDDVTNLNWHIDSQSYKVEKTEVAEDEFEYTASFNARKEIERGENKSTESYHITSKVSSDGKIISFRMTTN